MSQPDWDAVHRELEQQIERVKVDMFEADWDLHQIYAPSEHRISDTKSVGSHLIDVTGIVDTLRTLSDGAGTAAFVEAYNRQFPHYTDTESQATGHRGAPAVRFRTRPLPDDEMKRLCEDLGAWQPTLNVQLASSERDGGGGAIAPVDDSEAALARLGERLRADPRIVASTVAVGRFPLA